MSFIKFVLVFATIVALMEGATIGNADKSPEVPAEVDLGQQSLPHAEANTLFNKLETAKSLNLQDKGADFTVQQLPQEKEHEAFKPESLKDE